MEKIRDHDGFGPDPGEVLPCPFCGGIPLVESGRFGCLGGCVLTCKTCYLEMNSLKEESEEAAISRVVAKWNTRV